MSSNISGSPRPIKNGSRERQKCASCSQRRKRCSKHCIMAAYFPLERGQELKAVVKAFGFETVQKKLRDLTSDQERHEAVNSLIWSAEMWEKDPVRGPEIEYRRLEQELFSTKQELQRIIDSTCRPQQETPPTLLGQEEIGPNGSEDGAVASSSSFAFTDGHGEQERQGHGRTIPKLRIFFK